MATRSNNDIARAIYFSAKGKSVSEQDVVLKNVVRFLSRRRLLSKSGMILKALEKISNDDNGIIKVKLWSKNNLDPNIKKEILQLLKNRYGNKEIVLEERLDESLLGGFKIEINDELIDATFKNKIYKLQAYLNKNYE